MLRTVEELQFPIAGLHVNFQFLLWHFKMSMTRIYDCISNVLLNTNQAKVISTTSQPKCLPLWRQSGFPLQIQSYLEYPLHQSQSCLIVMKVSHRNSFTMKMTLPTTRLELWRPTSLEIAKKIDTFNLSDTTEYHIPTTSCLNSVFWKQGDF